MQIIFKSINMNCITVFYLKPVVASADETDKITRYDINLTSTLLNNDYP